MPQQPLAPYWRERIKSELALTEQQEQPVSNKRIRAALQKHADEVLKKHESPERLALAEKVPSERTIARIRLHEWDPATEVERAPYREFYWPESMERGDLPWEASSAALELLRNIDTAVPSSRPSIRFVRWFWHVSQAIPDASFEVRMDAAARLTQGEVPGESDALRGIEWGLAYEPWRSAGAKEKYLGATRRDHNPIPKYPQGNIITLREAGASVEVMNAALQVFMFEWDKRKGSQNG